VNQKKLSHFALLILVGAAILHPVVVSAQTPTPTPSYIVVVDSITTSFGFKAVSPTARFGHTIGGNGAAGSEVVTVGYHLSGVIPAGTIAEVDLLEDSVKVAFDTPPLSGKLSYTPSVAGSKILTVVSLQTNGAQVRSNGIPVQMFGVSLQTALGDTVTTPFLPFTSRIFLEADALLSDANIREAQFFHRSLPFELSTGVPYSAGDKVIYEGNLFGVLNLVSYAPGSMLPNPNGDPNYRYIGPKLVADLDYYNYHEAPPGSSTLIPQGYPAPPAGDSDLVISRNTTNGDDEVYQVITAGRLDPNVSPVPSLATTGGTAAGVVLFTFAGGPLQPNLLYFRGQLVVSNGRIYEVVQEGTTSADVSLGFQTTTGEIAVNGTCGFNFIPSKVLKDQLPYWKGDLVVSNGNAYRVTIAGTIATNGVGDGLHSISSGLPEPKPGVVTFQLVGHSFSPPTPTPTPTPYNVGDVFSANGRIYKVVSTQAAVSPTPTPGPPSSKDPYQQERVIVNYTSPAPGGTQVITVQLVVPQFQKYTEIDSDYAGVPLQEGKVYYQGDIVVSNGSLYKVITGGTMGPVGLGLIGTATQSLGGLVFEYVGPFFKQLSGVNAFADALFPYSSFDYSFPYSLKWSPAETITNPNSWFGPSGNFETHTNIELITRTTDSKDRTNLSFTFPFSILPPIDARAALTVHITDPLADRVVAAGTAVQITAEAKDANGFIRLVNSVQFFVDGVPLYAPDVTSPYTTEGPVHWTPTIAGSYILNALALDDKGNYTMSPDVRVNVTDNQPFVRITTPSSGDPFNPMIVAFGSAINIQGVLSGSGGDPAHIRKVELFSDGNSIACLGVQCNPSAPITSGNFAFTFAPTNASNAALNYQLTARVTDVNGSTATSNTVYIQVLPAGVAPPTPTPTPSPTPSPTPTPPPSGNDISTKLMNISTRGPVESGNDAMIAGFIIQGSSAKQVVLRGIGPSLTAVGVAGALQDPTLTLMDANGSLIAFNDDYGANSAADRQTLTTNGLTPTDSRESAIVAILAPGTYTAILRGKTNGTGVLEAYDLSGTAPSKFGNISTRGKVEQGDNGAMIAGFIVSAPSGQPGTTQRVAIRAIGPSLKNFGINDALLDPTLDIYRGSQLILSNDNWKTNSVTNQQIMQSNGLAPGNTNEAAVVMDLDPGSYSAVVRGKGNTTGVGLVEVYNLTQ
jgi:hypothetical protein